MTRTVRVGLVVALSLLIAAPVLAGGGGGKGKGRGGMMGMMGVGRLTMAMRAAQFTEDEMAKGNECIAKVKDQAAELAKKAMPNEDQMGKMMEVMADIRGKGLTRGTPEYQDALNKGLGLSDDQIKAQKDLAKLVADCLAEIKKAVPDKADALQKAYDSPPARGGKKKKADG